MKEPEYVRGARFASHAHYWDYKCAWAYVDGVARIYTSVVWNKRRKIP